MASRAVLPQHHPRGEVKQKNVLGDGRSRRVLQDIGNFVTERAPQGKKPITEVVNAVLAANGNAVGKSGAVKKVAAEQRKVIDKPKPETVIVISSDESDTRKRISGEESSKKSSKTFSSTLTARSKAACGLTNKPKDPVSDIDAADIDNELAVVEYIDDMYKFYKLTESEGRVHDYMDAQPDINAKMRSILVDWLTEVHRKFQLMPETLYLTINIVDRFLAKEIVPRRELQLVGISSMILACKYEEIWAPEVNDFVCISDNAYAREKVLAMEKSILGKLEWHFTVPTPYVFLVRYIKASLPADKEMENMVFFLAELGLMQYPTIILYCPSLLAASAVYAARCTLDKMPYWSETLKHHTGYSEDQLMNCAKMLAKFHSAAAESKLKAVYRKFSSPDRAAVALLAPAESLLPESS
ncbi:Cyclin [Melia azedarach]|uniref:Cyclin n=1 Tax=Melia azedarach TaxID=155640 RepID=A0ACC1YM45_MELAZ|nr:Cyclin [Melia azedarach]